MVYEISCHICIIYITFFNAVFFPFCYNTLIFIPFFRDKRENTKLEYYKMSYFWADMDFQTAPKIQEAIQERAAHGVFGYSIVPEEWYQAYMGW